MLVYHMIDVMKLLIVMSTLYAFGDASHMFDPFIICSNSTGVPSPPPGRPPFHTYLSLCSAVYGVPQMNMGCFCDHAYGNVHCMESLGDPYLWSASTILVNTESHQRTWVTCQAYGTACNMGIPT